MATRTLAVALLCLIGTSAMLQVAEAAGMRKLHAPGNGRGNGGNSNGNGNANNGNGNGNGNGPPSDKGNSKGKKCNEGACGFMQEAPGNGKAKCKACKDGWYTPKAGDCCVECNDGVVKIDSATSTATCQKCPAGSTFEKKGQSGSCKCPPGSQSTGADAVFGVAGCSLCPAGTASSKATTETDACKKCTENKVATTAGTDKCTPCKGNSTANAAGTACECAAGTYLFSKTVGRKDKLVQECRACANNSITATTNVASQCTPCTGNTATTDGITCSTCVAGYFNSATPGNAPVCSSCLAGYYLPAGGVCTLCTTASVNPDGNTWGACCATGTTWDVPSSSCKAP